MSKITNAWQAVELSRCLGRKPLRIMFQGQPVVLFRNGAAIEALTDMCPHRMVELSKGRVIGGEIECPYHGWRFNGGGALTHIPCSLEKLSDIILARCYSPFELAMKRTELRGDLYHLLRGATCRLHCGSPHTAEHRLSI